MDGHRRIITATIYVDKVYCRAVLGTHVTYKQKRSDYGLKRDININHNWHELREIVKKDYPDADLVLLMDSDVIATEAQLEALLGAFDGRPLALRTKTFGTGNHVCCACCLLTFEDWLKVDYVGELVDDCPCNKIRKFCGPVRYLEGQQACEYRDRARQSNTFHGVNVPFYTEMESKGGIDGDEQRPGSKNVHREAPACSAAELGSAQRFFIKNGASL